MKPNLSIKELFFNYPTRHWHFEELLKESGLSRAQTNEWLKKLKKDNLIKRIKPKGKMPYYIADYENPHYQNTKRLFALNKLHESGLLDYFASLEKAKSVTIFGSFSRGDWYKESDIDVFIYGDLDDVYVGQFMPKLKRDIQVFTSRNSKDLRRLGAPLIRNIIKGITIKGSIPNEVIANASV